VHLLLLLLLLRAAAVVVQATILRLRWLSNCRHLALHEGQHRCNSPGSHYTSAPPTGPDCVLLLLLLLLQMLRQQPITTEACSGVCGWWFDLLHFFHSPIQIIL
jgi:hypothetical protein